MGDIEWGPWIEHDGARPDPWLGSRKWPFCCTMVMDNDPALISESTDGLIGPSDPRFYWRWHRVRTGWFTWTRRRVCDDPAYAPIIRYRFGRPKQRSAAITRLAEIVANPSAPVTGPEGPVRAPTSLPARTHHFQAPGRQGSLPSAEKGGAWAVQGSGEILEDQCYTVRSGRLGRQGRQFPARTHTRANHGFGVVATKLIQRCLPHVNGNLPPLTPLPPQFKANGLKDQGKISEQSGVEASLFRPWCLPILPP